MEWKFKVVDPAEAKKYFGKKLSYTLGPAEVKHYRDEKVPFNIIDVRATEDFAKGHVPGAINLPEGQWDTLKGLSKDKPNVIYCYNIVCHLAAKAAHLFATNGFPVVEMEGGYEYWKNMDLEEEASAAA